MPEAVYFHVHKHRDFVYQDRLRWDVIVDDDYNNNNNNMVFYDV